MKTQTIASVMAFIVASASISGCASATKDTSAHSDIQVPEEAGAPTGAKAIFDSGYGPTVAVNTASPEPPKRAAVRKAVAQKPEKEMYMGVSYWVESVGKNGQMMRVTPSETFHGGDKIKLHLTSNRDGYLYLINQGSTGQTHVLFPYAGKDNFVRAHTLYTVPRDGHIRFDENPGEEILWVFLSSYPLGSREILPSSPRESGQFTTASYQCGYKDLVLDSPDQLTQVTEKCGAKDLVLEDDNVSSQPASYAVAPFSSLQQGGQVISLKIKLRHR